MNTTEKEGDIAWIIHNEIIENENQRRELMTRNGMLLQQMQDHHLYETILGDSEGEWSGYLGQIEVFYSRNKVFNLLKVVSRFNELLVDPKEWMLAPINRLAEVVKIIDSDNYQDWVSKASTLTSRDWTIEVRKAKGLTTLEDEHKHDMVTYNQCRKCGLKEKHHHDSESTSE